jgi:hypothetical protein
MTEDFPKPSLDPSLTQGNVSADAERRRQVEASVGVALDDVFTRNAEFVAHDENGRSNLTLHLERRDRDPATIGVSSYTDEGGNRTAYMSFGAKGSWDNHWRYTDGPTQEKRLVPCSPDPKTGELVPIVSSDPDTYDPNSDGEVVFWGKLWPTNLENATVEKPKVASSRLRSLGKRALAR